MRAAVYTLNLHMNRGFRRRVGALLFVGGLFCRRTVLLGSSVESLVVCTVDAGKKGEQYRYHEGFHNTRCPLRNSDLV